MTDLPARAAAIAAETPPGVLPTTTTSVLPASRADGEKKEIEIAKQSKRKERMISESSRCCCDGEVRTSERALTKHDNKPSREQLQVGVLVVLRLRGHRSAFLEFLLSELFPPDRGFLPVPVTSRITGGQCLIQSDDICVTIIDRFRQAF